MRYAIYVNEKCEKAATLDEAVGIMASLMYIDQADIQAQVEASGMGRAVYGFTTGQLSDLEWRDPNPTDPLDVARNKVRELYGEDGVLEVDDADTVSVGDDGYQVMVWVWVSESDAGIPEYMDEYDDMADLFVAAAEHPVAEFDGDSEASLGCDEGAYVSGWVCIGIDEDAAEAA